MQYGNLKLKKIEERLFFFLIKDLSNNFCKLVSTKAFIINVLISVLMFNVLINVFFQSVGKKTVICKKSFCFLTL